MNITALYKIFRGREFLTSSIQSVYNHCDRLVFVSSNVGWDGATGNNTLEVVKKFPDPLGKIQVVEHDTRSQEEQYRVGVDYIRANVKTDWILLIDSDEVWDDLAWELASDQLFNSPPDINACTCSMHTYIKNLCFRVDDSCRTQVRPVVFVRAEARWFGIRGNGVEPWRHLLGVYVHHFALVRESVEEVFRKMRTSHVGDKHGPPLVDLEVWKREVWDQIPGPAYHYYVGCRGVWQKTVEVDKGALPVAVQDMTCFQFRGNGVTEDRNGTISEFCLVCGKLYRYHRRD